MDGTDLSTMVGTDRASGSGLDLQSYARYQNRSGVSYFLFIILFLSCFKPDGKLKGGWKLEHISQAFDIANIFQVPRGS